MMKHPTLCVLLLTKLLSTPVQAAQGQETTGLGRIVALPPSSLALAVSIDTATGDVVLCGSDIDSIPWTPVRWTIDPGDVVESMALGEVDTSPDATCHAISDNATYHAGRTNNPANGPSGDATVWDKGDLSTPLFTGDPLPVSEALDISSSGVAVGTSGGAAAFKWSLRDGFSTLPTPAGHRPFGAWGASADGSIIAGSVVFGFSTFKAVVWEGTGGEVRFLENEGGFQSFGWDTSPNGLHVAGSAVSNQSLDEVAGAWFGRGNLQEVPYNGGLLEGIAYSITDDGFVAGTGDFGGAENEAFVWHRSWSDAKRFSDWVLESTGLVLPGTPAWVRDVFADGSNYHFALDEFGYYVQTPMVDVSGPLPTMTASGTCPGAVSIGVFDLTPAASFAILIGSDVGAETVPAGVCAGTPTGLSGLQLVAILGSDPDGSFSITRDLSAAFCGRPLQVLDVSSCAASNVVTTP